MLIENIVDSVNDYPREYLFINTNNEPYSEKSLQRMLYDLLKEKAIGVNSLRSSYASQWVPKCNANQVQRIAYLMRTSPAMLYKNYLKKSSEPNEQDETPKTNTTNNNTKKYY